MRPISIGHHNELTVQAIDADGATLGDDGATVRLPAPLPDALQVGDTLSVFVYTDRDGIVATTDKPVLERGQFGLLEVVDVTHDGAFLDWGLDKDLFLPFGRQHQRVRRGDRIVVAVSLHTRTNRLVASSVLSGHFDDDVSGLTVGEQVDLLVYGFTDRGVQVVVNQRHAGLVYNDHVHQRLQLGDTLQGYVLEVREDHRLDITLQRAGKAGTQDAASIILAKLDELDGFLPLHDKSSPQAVQRILGLSKKKFKKAVGALYKARKIRLADDGIHRVDG